MLTMSNPIIFSVEVLGATNRNVYRLGYLIHDRKIDSIEFVEAFVMELASPQYVCKDEDGCVLATISAGAPVVVEYKYLK